MIRHNDASLSQIKKKIHKNIYLSCVANSCYMPRKCLMMTFKLTTSLCQFYLSFVNYHSHKKGLNNSKHTFPHEVKGPKPDLCPKSIT